MLKYLRAYSRQAKEEKNQRTSERDQKRKIQTLKKIFTFVFAFARSECALTRGQICLFKLYCIYAQKMLIFAWIRVGSIHSDNSFYMYKVFQKSNNLCFLSKIMN